MITHPKSSDLLAYLNAEVGPSQKQLIRSHIADCQRCQKEIDKLSRLENQLQQVLHTQAAKASPGESAWQNLKVKLPVVASPHHHTIGGIQMKKLVPAAFLAAIFLAISLLFAVPGARAQFEEILTHWLWAELPDKSGTVSWGAEDWPFTPYTIGYFPDGFRSKGVTSGVIESPDNLSLTLTFDNGQDHYIKIVSSQGPDFTELPEGDPFLVNGQPAILVRGLEAESIILGEVDGIEKYALHEHFELTWFVESVQVEIFSNLPLDEILRIAKSARPMETNP
jgi:hypothetical protein